MITKEQYEQGLDLIQEYKKQERQKIIDCEKSIDKGLGKCMEKTCDNFAALDYNGCNYMVCNSCDDRLERHFEDEYN